MASLISGSCHCKKVQYIFDPSKSPDSGFAKKQGSRCNCRICQRTGFTTLSINEESLTFTTPASKADLKDYQPRNPDVHHYFCESCGVHILAEGVYVLEGQSYPFFTINLATFDQPQEGLDLSKWTMKYTDGLADNWMAGQKDKPWSGGLL